AESPDPEDADRLIYGSVHSILRVDARRASVRLCPELTAMADQITGLLSPFLRSRRLAAALPWLRGGPVLDVGCGVGELARSIAAERYVGVDMDPESIEIARRNCPGHSFLTWEDFGASDLRDFKHVAALAVIEHTTDPAEWLRRLSDRLAPRGDVVITTPEPRLQWAHELGAAVGIFSRESAEQHHELVDRRRIIELAAACDLRLLHAERFLAGANQLFILGRAETAAPIPAEAPNRHRR
ncbi:MAG: class I SAM-dependent methyltransferase, partial [Acidobacteriota bacterium]